MGFLQMLQGNSLLGAGGIFFIGIDCVVDICKLFMAVCELFFLDRFYLFLVT